MAIIPVDLVFLILVPGSHSVAQADDVASYTPEPAKVLRMPVLPKLQIPVAVDRKGRIHEPVIQAIYEEPLSAEAEEQGVRPSPQSLERLKSTPQLMPVAQQSFDAEF